jgi:hypothetical protein
VWGGFSLLFWSTGVGHGGGWVWFSFLFYNTDEDKAEVWAVVIGKKKKRKELFGV